MGYMLRPGLTYCETSGRLVFLDAAADRYFCLSADAESTFRDLAAGRLAAVLPAALLGTGLLVETPLPNVPLPCVHRTPPGASMLDAGTASGSMVLLATAMIRLHMVQRALRRDRLGRLLERLRTAKSMLDDTAQAPIALLQRLACDFERTARLTRSHDQCLSRSITLAQIAFARALRVDLVIGVRLHPFAAHSWVQAGESLLNDRVDSARTFTPILVL